MAKRIREHIDDTQALPRVLLLIESSRAYGRDCLVGIASYLRAHGMWNVLHLERGLEEEVPAIVKKQSFDGVIARIATNKIAKTLESMNVPTVDLRGEFQPSGGVSFDTDAAECARMAFEHFREKGFMSLGYCGYPGVDFSDDRGQVFSELCAQHRVKLEVYQPSKSPVRTDEQKFSGTLFREAEGELQDLDLIRWLVSLPKPVGVFCCNDIRGRQLLGAVQNAGLRVPGQIAVLGVDDDEVICELANPPLSSIQPNAQRIGFDGAAMLARLMAGEIPEAPLVLIPPIRINVRQSSDTTCVDDATVALALEFIGNNACLGIGVNDVANAVSVSRATLERRFKKHLRCSPREEIERVRIAKVKTLLVETDYKLEMIASMTAYTTASHLSIAFRRVVGTTPGEYRGQVEPRMR